MPLRCNRCNRFNLFLILYLFQPSWPCATHDEADLEEQRFFNATTPCLHGKQSHQKLQHSPVQIGNNNHSIYTCKHMFCKTKSAGLETATSLRVACIQVLLVRTSVTLSLKLLRQGCFAVKNDQNICEGHLIHYQNKLRDPVFRKVFKHWPLHLLQFMVWLSALVHVERPINHSLIQILGAFQPFTF